ncbi:MAG: flagellar basal body L-ring protein FlgH [Pseudomonadota bacterium]
MTKTKVLLTLNLPFLLASCTTIHTLEPGSSTANVSQELGSDLKKTQLESVERKERRNHPDYAPIHIKRSETIQSNSGSLFDPNNYNGILYKKENYRVGDMVKVTLMEKTEAYKTQNLVNEKSDEMSVGPLEINAGSINVREGDVGMSHKQDSKFDSQSNLKQENYLKGVINVFVNEVLQNGNLLVSGEKWIKLNEGDEYIRVSGEVRVSDISPENTIASTDIGNPLIEYSGTGRLMSNQKKGLISRVLSFFE